ncbi:deazaflavin-dependent oxidoreductase (nitroreductase family) [Actinopolyspora biskrensis]|uniref:Deazaflavin-dependent oxidoreductase (Nitroreductase family) n=1 Tax=Actinopolyspora biskrensis TaxID=1470178 RepID=A0A852YTB3_9ACTN|nr:nitroreductase family deazaflavin-dependent oxidoreductase [Actinopolyspora biskrensis]NYH76962.1 deazaflavin-dependent oxidoreductase (nitroreductase family) [Actinopolyspora biskrensis]
MTRKVPRGVPRKLLRTPIHLYRRNLGWLLGSRFVYLVHRGRSSGLPRETVLEVVRHRPVSGEVVVISGWGTRSHWYRNITASPALEIRIGRRRYHRPRQRVLGESETAELLAGYVREHPWAARLLTRLTGWPMLTPRGRAELARTLPAVSFLPREAEPPGPTAAGPGG